MKVKAEFDFNIIALERSRWDNKLFVYLENGDIYLLNLDTEEKEYVDNLVDMGLGSSAKKG